MRLAVLSIFKCSVQGRECIHVVCSHRLQNLPSCPTTLYPLDTTSPWASPLPPTLVITILLPVSMNLATLVISC